MNCKHCGTNLHPQAEICWKCSRFTAPEFAEKYEAILRVDADPYDPELSQAFDTLIANHSYVPEDGDEKVASDMFDLRMKRLLVPLNDETVSTSTLSAHQAQQPEVATKVIRTLRLFLGEEPEPTVLTLEMKQALTTIFWNTSIPPAIGIGIIVWAVAAHEVVTFFLGLAAFFISLCVVGAKLNDLWKFGKLKRMVMEEKKASAGQSQYGEIDPNWRSYLKD